jgi:hypothetical protein
MPSLSVQDVTVGEFDGFVNIVVTLDTASTSTVSVAYRQFDATARFNSDYRLNSGTLTFAPGETSKTVSLELINDTTAETPEHFLFSLSTATNATISRSDAMVQIVDNDTVVGLPQVFVRDVVVDEKAGTASFAVRLGGYFGESSSSTVSVAYTTTDGTAVAGQDFVARSGTLSFAPGESVKTVVVDLLDDTTAEGTERFNLVLSSPLNAALADATAVAEIGPSDVGIASQPRISVADVTVGEADGYVDLVVGLSAPSNNVVTVDYRQFDDSAGYNSDYRLNSGTLTFAPGETTKTVRIELLNDTTAEGPETFDFALSAANNAALGRASAMVQIVDNDTIVDLPQVFVRDVVVDEKAGTASFVVQLGAYLGESSSSTVTVAYATADGTAVAGQDFVAQSAYLSFAPGESAKTVVVDLLDDATAEGLERFSLLLYSPVNAALGDATAVAEIGLSDGTVASQPRISVADVTVGEADGYVDLVVSLNAPSNNLVTVDYRQFDDSAGYNSDYRLNSGTLTFAPGETTKAVRVQLLSDLTAEGPEYFDFTLSGATNAAIGRGNAMVQIVDNDSIVDVPQVFVRDVVVDEKAGTASFVVRLGAFRGETSSSTVTVAYTTTDGTAVAGQDFVARSGSLSFAPGESVKTVVVDLLDDTTAEGLERFNLVLSSPVNAALADATAVAEIGPSDGTVASQPRISVADVTVGEADGYVDLVVSLSAPSNNLVTVDYRQFDDSAGYNSDYRLHSGSLSFVPGETTKTVRIELINDTNILERPENFHFSLSGATNASIGRATAMVQIVDNDSIVDTPLLFVRDVVVDEKAGTASFVVRLGANSGESSSSTVSVDFSTTDGTAVVGQDFVGRSGTLSFAPGESAKTVVVDLVDDTLAEGLERFNLVLSNPVGAALGDAVAVAEIGRSDGPTASQPSLAVADVTVGEADGYLDLVVSLSAPTTNTVTVQYRQNDDTARYNSDYRLNSGTLTFGPGETTKTVRIELINDTAPESAESFRFTLSSASNATLPAASTTVTVLDNDSSRPLLSHGRSNDTYTISSAEVDFIEAVDGGFDVVRSSVSFGLPPTLEGVILTGSAASASGNASNNFFQGNASNNTFNGLDGIDTVAFGGRSVDYVLSGNTTSRTVSGAGDGTDTLLSIERLQFSNTILAHDTTPGGNTYQVYALLHSILNSAPSMDLVSQWTAQQDQLGDLTATAKALLQFYAPDLPNDALAAHLWFTTIGTPITPDVLAQLVGVIDNGSYTQASFLETIALLPISTDEFAAIVGQPLALDPAWFPLPAG